MEKATTTSPLLAEEVHYFRRDRFVVDMTP